MGARRDRWPTPAGCVAGRTSTCSRRDPSIALAVPAASASADPKGRFLEKQGLRLESGGLLESPVISSERSGIINAAEQLQVCSGWRQV